MVFLLANINFLSPSEAKIPIIHYTCCLIPVFLTKLHFNMPKQPQFLSDQIRMVPILLYALIAITVFNFLFTKKQFPRRPVEITVDKDITLQTGPEYKELRTYTLHAGEIVSYLGFEEQDLFQMNRIYVQTQDGIRGFVNAYELGFPVIHKTTRDTVIIINPATDINESNGLSSKALVRYPDGSEKEVNYDKLLTALPKELRSLMFNDSRSRYISERKFKRQYVGKKLHKCDKLNYPALLVNHEEDGTIQAYYDGLFVYKAREGQFYRPVVYTDQESVITDYKLINKFGNNRWILKVLPFESLLMDLGPFSSIINNSLYDKTARFYDVSTGKYNWTRWIAIIFYVVFGFIWIFGYGSFILIILRTALIWPRSFYHLKDKGVIITFAITTIITAYIWFLLIMVWGLVWPIALLTLLSAYFLFKRSIKGLDCDAPHFRCLNCRRLDTMMFTESIFVREYDEMREETEIGKFLGQDDKYTKTTWKEGVQEGKKVTSEETDHYDQYDIHEILHYNVLYHVKVYHDLYNCHCCDNQEKVIRTEQKQLDKVFTHKSVRKFYSGKYTKKHYGRLPS